MRNAAIILAIVVVVLCAAAIAALVFGALASLASDKPGEENRVADLGHRAVVWTAALCGMGVVALITIQEWWPS